MHTAVREAGVSPHAWIVEDTPENPPKSQLYGVEEFKGGGSSIGPPLCQEAPASRTAEGSFSSPEARVELH